MAANIIYISAGLPVAKDSGQAPSSGVNTVYISAGLPPEVLSAPATKKIPVFMNQYRQRKK